MIRLCGESGSELNQTVNQTNHRCTSHATEGLLVYLRSAAARPGLSAPVSAQSPQRAALSALRAPPSPPPWRCAPARASPSRCDRSHLSEKALCATSNGRVRVELPLRALVRRGFDDLALQNHVLQHLVLAIDLQPHAVCQRRPSKCGNALMYRPSAKERALTSAEDGTAA